MSSAARNTTLDIVAIAVDFATTYSGIAYLPLDDLHSEPTQLSNWPGKPLHHTSYKVPTVLAYPSDPTLPYLWGYSAEKPPFPAAPNSPPITYHKAKAFKAFLRPEYTSSYHGPPGKSLPDIVSDFLQSLYEHLIYTLSGQGLGPERWRYRVMFTVPAPFSTSATEALRRCVENTGWAEHEVLVELTEPEAAALHTIRTQQRVTREIAFKPNQCFLVVDAGGGTVDLASYNITELSPVTRMAQTGVIHGDVCGSTNIDNAFKRYIKSILPADVDAEHALSDAAKYALADEFVVMKEQWMDSPASEYEHVRVPYDCPVPAHLQRSGYLVISREQMRAFFSESVDKTCALVRDHVHECLQRGYRVSYLFLVGGFGTSPYLRTKLDETLVQLGTGAMIICPRQAEQSVVLGALSYQRQLLLSHHDPISLRRSRAHLGLLISKPFHPALHRPDEMVVNRVTGEVLAKNQVLWILRMGDPILSTTAEIERELVRYTRERPTMAWTETLVESVLLNPPARLGPGVRTVCQMVTDMRGCKLSELTPMGGGFEKSGGFWGGLFRRSMHHPPRGPAVAVHTSGGNKLVKGGRRGMYTYNKKGREEEQGWYEARYTVKVFAGMTSLSFEMWFGGARRNELLDVRYSQLRDPEAVWAQRGGIVGREIEVGW
ncbi:hypothetical protein DFH27DRAFT_637650 [Peziza echinospora]|nr:hypothetical protein DFH27DRAFT_637650 [Peziza echinospora]